MSLLHTSLVWAALERRKGLDELLPSWGCEDEARGGGKFGIRGYDAFESAFTRMLEGEDVDDNKV